MSDPTPIYNPWRESLENCINGSNYLRAREYRDLIEELDDYYLIKATLASQGLEMIYEVILPGFSADTDATDDKLLWVKAPNISAVHKEYPQAERIAPVYLKVHPKDIDKVLT